MRLRLLKIGVVTITIFALLGTPLLGVAQTAHAAIGTITTGATECALVGGLRIAIPKILTAISLGTALKSANRVISFLTFGLVSIPDPTIDVGQIGADTFFNAFARCMARVIMDQTIAGILNTIQTGGRDGGASYVRNWRNFQSNAEYRGEALFRSILANTPVCDYLRSDVDQAYRVTAQSKVPLQGINLRIGSLDPFTLRGRCTLPDGFDITQYQQDFAANGGWAALNRIMEPQNNPYGFALIAADEQDNQRAAEVAADTAEANATGYLALRGADSCLQRADNGTCLIYNNIKSPASYVSAAAASTIQSELNWLTDIHTIEDLIINSVVSRVVSRLNDLSAPELPNNYQTAPIPDTNNQPAPQYCPDPSNLDAPLTICAPGQTPLTAPPPSTPGPNPQPTSSTAPGNSQCSRLSSGQFASQVNAAIDQFIANNPSVFSDISNPVSPTVAPGQANTYTQGVVSILQGQGLQAQWDPEEFQLKQNSSFSETYDIITSGNLVRHAPGAYRLTCSPAAF